MSNILHYENLFILPIFFFIIFIDTHNLSKYFRYFNIYISLESRNELIDAKKKFLIISLYLYSS